MKKLLLLLALGLVTILPCHAQPTYYNGLYFDGGTNLPGSCTPPGLYYKRDTTTFYGCGVDFTYHTMGSTSAPVNPYTNPHSGNTFYAPPEVCQTTVSTILTDFQQSATSAQVKLFTAPAFWSPRSFRIVETTTVTSGAGTVTAVAASIGTTGSPSGYSTSFPLMGASSPTFRENTGGTTLATTENGTQDVYLQLAVTNTSPGNLSGLTGGVVTIRACGVVLQ